MDEQDSKKKTITTIKPYNWEITARQLVLREISDGIEPIFNHRYMRRVRISRQDNEQMDPKST